MAENLIDDIDDSDDNDDDYDDFRGGGGKDGGIGAPRRCMGGRKSNSNRSSSGFAIDVENSPDPAARCARILLPHDAGQGRQYNAQRARRSQRGQESLWLECRDAVFVVSGRQPRRLEFSQRQTQKDGGGG